MLKNITRGACVPFWIKTVTFSGTLPDPQEPNPLGLYLGGDQDEDDSRVTSLGQKSSVLSLSLEYLYKEPYPYNLAKIQTGRIKMTRMK